MKEDNIRTEEVIGRVNRYLSLMRYNYMTQEKLTRLNAINDYYLACNTKSTEEVFKAGVESAEQFSGNLTLPLKVRGVFLLEGRPKAKYYKAEELRKAVFNKVNQKFPIMLDHRDNEASTVVGVVEKLSYDEELKGIRWWGHINDETFARNILDGVVKEVSATVFSETDNEEGLGIVGKNLTFKELSLVMTGAVKGNYIEAY